MKKITTSEFIQKAIFIHNNKYDYSKSVYINSKTKLIIICSKCNIEFLQRPDSHLLGQGCKNCQYLNKRLSKYSVINKANKIHNNKYLYTLNNYKNNKDMISIYCKLCKINFNQSVANHLSGRGCKKCSYKTNGKKLKKTLTDFILQANKVHNNKYNYNLVIYYGSKEKIKIKCLKCEKYFYQLPFNHLKGHGCGKCSNRTSTLEIHWLNFLNIKEENRQISLPKLPKRWKVDGYDSETNTVYEFNGDYWHGNPTIYNVNDYNISTKTTFGELYNNTIKRNCKIKKAGYNLISIWESEWKEQINVK